MGYTPCRLAANVPKARQERAFYMNASDRLGQEHGYESQQEHQHRANDRQDYGSRMSDRLDHIYLMRDRVDSCSGLLSGL